MVSGKTLIQRIKKDKFLSNSLIFFVGSFLVNIGNYFFHFLMTRMLSVEHYGELQSLLAVSIIFSIPIGALSTVLVKYTAHFKAKERLNKIYSLFLVSTKNILIIAVLFSLIFFALSSSIANFLNLSAVLPVIILGASFLPSFLGSINRGIIQGLQKFKSTSVIGIIEVFFKVLLGALLVKLSFGVNGAVGAIVLAGLIGYLIAFLPLKFLFGKEKEKIEKKEIFRYYFPTLFTLLFMTLLYNIDIVLVKHFLPPYAAGEYGALTLIGHIIFFISGPIVGVMFPMAAAARANNHNPDKILRKTVILVGLMGLAVLGFYFLFPNFIIKLLVSSKFLTISKFLGWFAVSMFLYSLVSLFSQYFLSTHKPKCFWLVGIGVTLQVVLISIWHQNLWQIIWIMNVTMLATLGLLLAYYFKTKKEYALSNL